MITPQPLWGKALIRKCLSLCFVLLFLVPVISGNLQAQCNLGASEVQITLPHTGLNQTTCGAGDSLTSSNTINCGSSSYLDGEDLVYIFTAPTTDLYHFTLTKASLPWSAMKLYDGCPRTGQGSTCISSISSHASDKIMPANLTSSTTYYLVIDRFGGGCYTFDLRIAVPDTCPAPNSPGWPVITLPFSDTALTNCGAGDDLRYYNTINCGSSSYFDGEDIVYIFTAPTTDLYHFTLTSASLPWAAMKLYDGCPLTDQGSTCIASIGTNPPDKIMPANLTSSTTYYLVIDRFGGGCYTFDLRIAVPDTCPAPNSPGWPVITLPFSDTALTNCGAGDDLKDFNTINCGSSSYFDGEDIVYIFTSPTTELYHFTLTNASAIWSAMKLYDGCPLTGQGSTCIASIGTHPPDKIMAANLTSSTTYYLVIDRSGSGCFTFDLEIAVPKTCPTPGSPGWPVITLPFSDTALTNCGAGDDLKDFNTINCGSSSYFDGEDIVYIFTSPTTDLYHFTLTNASANWSAMKLYDGCPLTGQGSTCIASIGTHPPDKIMPANLTSSTTYYLVIDLSGSGCFTFDLTIDLKEDCPATPTQGWTFISSIPYQGANETTCGMGDKLTDYNTINCGSSAYFGGEDHVYVFSVPTNDLYNIALMNATQANTGLKLYENCPLLDGGGSCVSQLLNGTADKILPVNLQTGKTYFLVVDNYYKVCFDYDLSISVPIQCPGSDTTGWTFLNSFPVYIDTQSTCGNGNQITAINATSCGSSSYLSGEDQTYVFTPSFTDSFYVRVFGPASVWKAIKVYAGCPFIGTGGTCVDHITSYTPEALLRVWMQTGQDYYIVVDGNISGCYDFRFSIDTVPVCPVVPPIVSAPGPLCPGAAAPTLQVTNPLGTVTWYADEMLDSVLGTGPTYTPASAENMTLYVTNASYCESEATPVTLQLLSLPAIAMQDEQGIQLTERSLNFASGVPEASSNHPNPDFGSNKLIGAPDVYPQTGPIAGSWTPDTGTGGRAYLELRFSNPAPTSAIALYEVANPGGIDTIYGLNPQTDKYELLWTGVAAPAGTQARIFQADFDLTSYPLQYVRLAINTGVLNGPYHLDAVALMVPRNLMCKGDTVTLFVPAVGTYSWSTGATTPSIQVHPADTTTYSVAVTSPQCTYNVSITVNVLDLVAPVAVTGMLPADSAINVPLFGSFSWQPAAGATDYDFYVWPDSAMQPTSPHRSAITNIQTTVLGGLSPGRDYKWQIVSNNHTCGIQPGLIQSFSTIPFPDLVVTSFQADTIGFTGQKLSISFTVKNQGNGSTGAQGWHDAIFLSLDTILDLEDDFIVNSYPNPRFLLPGESYTQNLEINIPRNIFGGFYLIVAANYKCRINRLRQPPFTVNSFGCQNPLNEVTLDNNLLVSNTTINFQMPILPDLEVITFAPPATSFAGDSITISYTVQNTGSDEANSTVAYLVRDMCEWIPPSSGGGSIIHISEPRIYCGLYEPFWIDQVYWSRDSVFDIFQDTLLYEERIGFLKDRFETNGHVVPGFLEPITMPDRELRFNAWYGTPSYLAINESYMRQRKLLLPECAAGTYYLHFVTDATNFAWESDEMGNNVMTKAIEILPTPPPDLVVDSIRFDVPVFSSTLVRVEYQIENIGASEPAFDFWANHFYISPTPTLDSNTAIYLKKGYVKDGKQILTGTSKWYQTHVYIPQGLDGPYHLIVVADAEDMVCEFDDNNNTGSVPMHITLTPPPDLEVTSLVTSSPIRAEDFLHVDYTISNTGPGVANAPWRDSVWISDKASLDTTAILLGWYENRDTLPNGGFYDNDGDVFLPRLDTGAHYLYIMTDAGDRVYEHNNEHNNLYRHGPFQVLPRLYSDLAVSSVTVPGSGSSGTQVPFEYTVENLGPGITNSPEWLDRFYLSPDSVFGQDTIGLLQQSYLQPLPTGNSYTKSGMLTFPNGLSGAWYLHLVADAQQLVENDTARANNVYTQPMQINLSPSADLAITSVDLPDELYTGVLTAIPYTVTNLGTADAAPKWRDHVALSIYDDLDKAFTSLHHIMHERTLAPSQSYSDTLWVTAPNHLVGNYYLILMVDFKDLIYEHQAEANNKAIKAIRVIQSPPADLEVTGIVVPASATPGKPAELTYHLTNSGSNPVTSTIYNNAYVAGNNLPSMTSRSLWGHHSLRSYTLAPNTTDTLTFTGIVPAMREGYFRSEVTANVTQSASETNYANNTALSGDSTLSIIPVLPLGVTVSDTLSKQASNYYRLNLPADADLRVRVQSGAAYSNNAIFIRHLDVPDGPNYHRRNVGGDVSDPVLLVPGTSAGANYIQVRNSNVNQVFPTQAITIRAELLPFGIDSIKPNVMGQGRVTSKINGAGFRQGLIAQLVDGRANQVVATGIVMEFLSSMELVVRWHLDQVPVGVYDLYIINPNSTQTILPSGVVVEQADSMKLSITPAYEKVLSTRGPATFGFTFRNESNVDIPYVSASFYHNTRTRLVGTTSHPKVFTRSEILDKEFNIQSNGYFDRQVASDSSFELSNFHVLMNNLSPNEEIGFSLIFRDFPYGAFSIRVLADVHSPNSFMEYINYSVNLFRMGALADPNMLAPLEIPSQDMMQVLSYFSDSTEFVHASYSSFIDIGLLEASDTSNFSYSCTECPKLTGGSSSVTPYWGAARDEGGWREATLPTLPVDQYLGLLNSDLGPPGGGGGGGGGSWLDPPPGCESWGQAAGNFACNFLNAGSDPEYLCPAVIGCGLITAAGIALAPFIIKGGFLGAVATTGLFGGATVATWGPVAAQVTAFCLGQTTSCALSIITDAPTSVEAAICAEIVEPCDPNEIQGPTGYGDERFISVHDTVHYTVLFENDADFASAPAQGVRIEVPISDKANPLSVRLGGFGFANHSFEVPPNVASYQNRLDLRDSLGIYVDVIAGLDITRNIVFWQFESVDPNTGLLPSDPFKGLLPINDSLGNGEGYVKFHIRPDQGSQTGDTLGHYADIYFDLNPPITTNFHFNTIDALPPTATITGLPAISKDSVLSVTFTVADDPGGSGVARTLVYVQRNGDPLTLLTPTSDTSLTYEASPCDTIRFKVIGVDNVGNKRTLTDTSGWAETVVARSNLSLGPDQLICPGENATLTAPQSQSYVWSTGATTQQVVVQPAVDTRYYVTVMDAQGCPGIASVLVMLDTCTGITPPMARVPVLEIRPNPVSGSTVDLYLSDADPGSYQIVLRDQYGRALHREAVAVPNRQMHRFELGIQQLSSGIYFVELWHESLLTVKKMAVQR